MTEDLGCLEEGLYGVSVVFDIHWKIMVRLSDESCLFLKDPQRLRHPGSQSSTEMTPITGWRWKA